MPRQPTATEIRLDNITATLRLTLPLLNELNDAIGTPFILSILSTVEVLITSVQLMGNIHEVLFAIVNLHTKSETLGSLPPLILDNIKKFMETLHKIYTFIEAQQEGNKIKQLFRNNEMNKLLQDCHAGLNQAIKVFGIHTGTDTLNSIADMKETTNLMHKELIELIEKCSDASTVSERSSVYMGLNEFKNRFCSKFKLILHVACKVQNLPWACRDESHYEITH
ncbi:hypothetical protein K438DRAFT_1761227 [Mycena galopus ATCC 62051]|nr:hypothetical protein K438DRAFT_1761227 [Mycena galopus ATCC 62051]